MKGQRQNQSGPVVLVHGRYGCHEVRNDSEMVIVGRATSQVSKCYFDHLAHCSHCRRFHRILNATYLGPELPIGLSTLRQEQEFSDILARIPPLRRPVPFFQRFFGQLHSYPYFAASVLAVFFGLFWFAPQIDLLASFSPTNHDPASQSKANSINKDQGGIEHHSQNFGRVIAGAVELQRTDSRSASPDTFQVGTKILVDQGEPVQVTLLGKILASFQPKSHIRWMTGAPSLVELYLEQGMLAIRYDRLPADPILQIHTPDAVVRVIGTVFTVAQDSKGQTSVSVLRGKVDVLDPVDLRLMAEVEAGFRFDVATTTFSDLGRTEVEAALPLSNEGTDLATGQIPDNWAVPGLPSQSKYRRVDHIPDIVEPSFHATVVPPVHSSDHSNSHTASSGRSSGGERLSRTQKSSARRHGQPSNTSFEKSDEEIVLTSLLERAIVSAHASKNHKIAREVESARVQCADLYDSPRTRFLAADCLNRFLVKYRNAPQSIEGLLLLGILRMDFARDYQQAIRAFESFLEQAPKHPRAEMAAYRRVLAHIESGSTTKATHLARQYLESYPNGAHVGHILLRFPKLHHAL